MRQLIKVVEEPDKRRFVVTYRRSVVDTEIVHSVTGEAAVHRIPAWRDVEEYQNYETRAERNAIFQGLKREIER